MIALAAQDLAKNLLGGVTIIIDKPFKIGDFIETEKFSGVVEDITFRSTRIRNLENSQIIIPNSNLVDSAVKNWSNLESRRFSTDLVIELETNLEKVKSLINELKFSLEKNNFIIKDSVNVTFSQIKGDGINLFVYAYLKATSYVEFLELSEKMNMQIMEILEKEEVKLAYKTETIYLKNNI